MTNIVMIVALTIWGEARGEDFDSKWAVATVIYNRGVGIPRLMAQECQKPKQFSCWNSGEVVAPDLNNPVEAAAWNECSVLATALVHDWFRPLPEVKHATHYHADYVSPGWASRLAVVGRVGRHLFYL